MFILKVFILINNQLLSTANAKDFNKDYYRSDFPNESNGIFVIGVVFSQTNFDFLTSYLPRDFLILFFYLFFIYMKVLLS